MAASMTRKEILGKVYKMVPPMLESFHKGTLRQETYRLSQTLASAMTLTSTRRSAWTSSSHRR